MDSLILPWVNAHTMSMFLSTVSQRHPDEYIVMVMDQAGWHISQELEVPQNIRLVFLPPYSPELNPAGHIWDTLRENCIGNTVFASLEAADEALSEGLRSLESDHQRMQSLTGFSWIISISLNAKYNYAAKGVVQGPAALSLGGLSDLGWTLTNCASLRQ